MTKSELEILRKTKVDAVESIVQTRGEEMTDVALASIKSIKDEIKQIDLNIEAINEIRSVALEAGKPVEEKKADAKDELREAFAKYTRGDITGREYETRANTVGANGDVVPDEFLKELQETILEYGMLNSAARHLPTDTNGTISVPVINDTTTSGVWTAESGAITKADFTTATKQMGAFKVATGIEVSTELIEDASFNLESYIADALGTRLGRAIEGAIVNGTGSGQPEGILVNSATTSYPSAVAGVVDSTDLITAVFELQPSSRIGAKIYVSDDLMKDLTLEVDADGRPLLQQAAGATPADPVQMTLNGYPVIVNYELVDVAVASESAFIGNMDNYMVRDVRNIKVTRDEYSGMANDMVSFYATARLDGKVISANDSFVKVVTAG